MKRAAQTAGKALLSLAIGGGIWFAATFLTIPRRGSSSVESYQLSRFFVLALIGGALTYIASRIPKGALASGVAMGGAITVVWACTFLLFMWPWAGFSALIIAVILLAWSWQQWTRRAPPT